VIFFVHVVVRRAFVANQAPKAVVTYNILHQIQIIRILSIQSKLRTLMPRFVIERELPGAGNLTREQLTAISQKSCDVLNTLGTGIQWVESFVTEDKIYCVYVAQNKEIIKQHAEMGGFPANRIEEIKTVISPVTAEEKVAPLPLTETSHN
jgi:hypothetical protein